MIIFYDHQIFSWQNVGGISRYFSELQKHFSKIKEVQVINSTFLTSNLYLSDLSLQGVYSVPGIYIPGKVPLIKLINQLFSIFKLKKSSYDIFHPTYYNNYFLNYLGKKPLVITVYDMIHELFPQDFPGDKTSVTKKAILSRASHIIAISSSTKNDLVKLFKTDPSKISVIPLASSLNPNLAKSISLPASYLLYVGDRGKYKNFTSLIKISSQLFSSNKDLHIICVGGGIFSKSEIKLMGNNSPRFKQYSMSDEELVYAYKNAECLVITSLYEGFGLPMVEAMQCGCPVVSSNSASLLEVGGAAVLYFDPTDSKSMLKQIRNVLSKKEIRLSLIKLGLRRSKKYSWEKASKQTLEVYRKI